jgi:hypothetical protein
LPTTTSLPPAGTVVGSWTPGIPALPAATGAFFSPVARLQRHLSHRSPGNHPLRLRDGTPRSGHHFLIIDIRIQPPDQPGKGFSTGEQQGRPWEILPLWNHLF